MSNVPTSPPSPPPAPGSPVGGPAGSGVKPKARGKIGDLGSHFHRLLNADLGDSPSRSVEILSYIIRLTRETVRELARARCFLRASALAYSTILSLVPLLAMLMALLSMPALSSHQEKVINQIAEGLTPGVDETKFWGQKGVERFVRVTIKDKQGRNEEIVGEQIGTKGFPNYPENNDPIQIKRQITLETLPDEEEPLPAKGTVPESALNLDRRIYFVTTVDKLEPVYSEGEAGGRIREIGLGDQGKRKATFYAYLGNFTSKAGAVGLIGFILLMYIVYSMLNRIELTFSDIWGITKQRGIFQRLSLYTALVFWGPIVMVASNAALEFLARLGYLPGFSVRLLGVCVTAMALTCAYIILPNTTVKFRSALTGGIFAAVLWVLATYGFSSYIAMTGGGSYQRIYGTMGLLPMLLIMIYMSWVILLFGAVVSFTIQNFSDLDRKHLMQNRAEKSQVYMALRLFVEIVRQFRRGPTPVVAGSSVAGKTGAARKSARKLGRTLLFRRAVETGAPLAVVATELEVPPYAVEAIAQKLIEAGMLVETEENSCQWLPARDPDQIPVELILQAVRPKMLEVPQGSAHPERDGIARVLKGLQEAEETQLGDLSIGQLTRNLDALRSAQSGAQAAVVEKPGTAGEPAPA